MACGEAEDEIIKAAVKNQAKTKNNLTSPLLSVHGCLYITTLTTQEVCTMPAATTQFNVQFNVWQAFILGKNKSSQGEVKVFGRLCRPIAR